MQSRVEQGTERSAPVGLDSFRLRHNGTGGSPVLFEVKASRGDKRDFAGLFLPGYCGGRKVCRNGLEFLDLAPGQIGTDPTAAGKALSQSGKIGSTCRSVRNPIRPVGDQENHPTVRGDTHSRSRTESLPDQASRIADSPDFVIVSRGRGKPATLLGGGAVWARDHESFSIFSAATFPLEGWNMSYAALRAQLYNCAIHPLPYNAITRLPFLHLGETRLKDLQAITRLPRALAGPFGPPIETAIGRHRRAKKSRTLTLAAIVLDLSFAIPADALQTADTKDLTGLPVLCRDAQQAAMAGKCR